MNFQLNTTINRSHFTPIEFFIHKCLWNRFYSYCLCVYVLLQETIANKIFVLLFFEKIKHTDIDTFMRSPLRRERTMIKTHRVTPAPIYH